jgi:hypothetical protein
LMYIFTGVNNVFLFFTVLYFCNCIIRLISAILRSVLFWFRQLLR